MRRHLRIRPIAIVYNLAILLDMSPSSSGIDINKSSRGPLVNPREIPTYMHGPQRRLEDLGVLQPAERVGARVRVARQRLPEGLDAVVEVQPASVVDGLAVRALEGRGGVPAWIEGFAEHVEAVELVEDVDAHEVRVLESRDGDAFCFVKEEGVLGCGDVD